MDVDAALEVVARWCADDTTARYPDRAVEVDCNAVVWITIGESAPPWDVRWERRCSAGAMAPMAQLRYDPETREWGLHSGLCGWSEEPVARADRVGPLLEVIAAERDGRFRGLPPGFQWRANRAG